jgi:hypothetical protein
MSENAVQKDTSSYEISFKVSPKGGCSVYGLQKFPVTLYKDQWSALIDNIGDLKNFIKENEADLKMKD